MIFRVPSNPTHSVILRVLQMLAFAATEAALGCLAIKPADLVSCAYVPVDRIEFTDP